MEKLLTSQTANSSQWTYTPKNKAVKKYCFLVSPTSCIIDIIFVKKFDKSPTQWSMIFSTKFQKLPDKIFDQIFNKMFDKNVRQNFRQNLRQNLRQNFRQKLWQNLRQNRSTKFSGQKHWVFTSKLDAKNFANDFVEFCRAVSAAFGRNIFALTVRHPLHPCKADCCQRTVPVLHAFPRSKPMRQS